MSAEICDTIAACDAIRPAYNDTPMTAVNMPDITTSNAAQYNLNNVTRQRFLIWTTSKFHDFSGPHSFYRTFRVLEKSS